MYVDAPFSQRFIRLINHQVLWQAALVKLPRAVPTAVLKYTSPLGPQPFILDLPSREYETTKRTIPVFVFLPPIGENDPYKPGSTAANSVASLVSQTSQISLSSTTSKDSKTSKNSTTNGASKENIPTIEQPTGGAKDVAVRALPVIVDFHGGGFFMGSPLEQAPFCAQMARNLSCVVISVDYRMGPIDKFPGAVTDAEDIINQIIRPQPQPSVKHDGNSYTGSWRSGSKKHRRHHVPSSAGILDLQNTISYKVNEAQFNNRKAGRTPQPMKIKLDRNRVAVCGFSSGGNIALNMAVDVPADAPHMPADGDPWLSPFSVAGPQRPSGAFPRATGEDAHLTSAAASDIRPKQPEAAPSTALHPSAAANQPQDPTRLSPISTQTTITPEITSTNQKPQIPLLLFYPSLDLRQLPSERMRPEALGPHPTNGPSFWSRLNDTLAPSYCSTDMTDHRRASPGLASPAKDIHPDAKMFLVTCAKDTLYEQSEAWISKVIAEDRGDDLSVQRYNEKHGWTQMPETWLTAEEKRTRAEVFMKAEGFLRASWSGDDPIEAVKEYDERMKERVLDGEGVRAEAAAKAAGQPLNDEAGVGVS